MKKHEGKKSDKARKKILHKDGFDSNNRWGNSAIRGYGVNSPAMMEARKNK